MQQTSQQQSHAKLAHALQALEQAELLIPDVGLEALSDLSQGELLRFQETWRKMPPARRRLLIEALVDLAQERIDVYFNNIFQWLLNDADDQVRVHAINGLWEEESVRLVRPLVQLLRQDPAPQVRAAAAIALGRYLLLGELEKIDSVSAMLAERTLLTAFTGGERDEVVRRRVLESLAYSAEAGVHDLIAMAYEDEDAELRISAVCAMGRSADPRWARYVLVELASADPVMRFQAARASGELGLEEATPWLIGLLGEQNVTIRQAAVQALGRIGGPEARRALEICCASEDEALAEAAEQALAELEFMEGGDDWFSFYFEDADDLNVSPRGPESFSEQP